LKLEGRHCSWCVGDFIQDLGITRSTMVLSLVVGGGGGGSWCDGVIVGFAFFLVLLDGFMRSMTMAGSYCILLTVC
jgi:hypothetical protein